MNHGDGAAAHGGLGVVFGGLALLLVVARLGGHLAARFKLPAVLGELAAGLVLGNLGIARLAHLRSDTVLNACAELGVLLLMFEVGLESDPREIGKVGGAATAVAVIGVVAPLVLGAGVSAVFAAGGSVYAHLFVGATLAATSVGITARVLRDLGKTQSIEAQIILAAAVLDDILGLVLLALVAAFVRAADRATSVSLGAIALLLARAGGFLVAAVVLGRLLVPRVFRLAARMLGKGTLITTALAVCLAYAFAAELAGLAPAIGAFFAGLVIRAHDYAELTRRGEGTLEEPLGPLSAVFVPLFFVIAGARVDLGVFRDPKVIALAAVLTLVAALGKLVAGLGARRKGVRRLAIGIGMMPRGEVGLIFATVGATLTLHGEAVISRPVFSAVVVMVVVTSLLPPPLLARAMRDPPARDSDSTQRRAAMLGKKPQENAP